MAVHQIEHALVFTSSSESAADMGLVDVRTFHNVFGTPTRNGVQRLCLCAEKSYCCIMAMSSSARASLNEDFPKCIPCHKGSSTKKHSCLINPIELLQT